MAIQFPCSRCGTPIEVGDEYAGGRCECPNCNASVTIPGPAGEQPQPVEPSAVPPPPMPRMSPPTETQHIPPADPGRKGWATAALICGVLGFCLPPLGLVAIVCGIVALVKINRDPKQFGGKGLAIAGISTGAVAQVMLVIYALIFAIMLPSLARARELAKRSVCAANLKGMGVGFYTYANENNNAWPDFFDSSDESAPPGGIDYTGAIGSYRGKAGNPTAGDILNMNPRPGRISTTRELWTLIRMQISSPKPFVCPSSTDMPNADANPMDYWDFGQGDITGPASPAQVKQGWSQVSYGYQVPFGKLGRPSSERDPRMVLAADKGPFGAAIDGGLPAPPPINVGLNAPPDDWRTWNSPNHGGQGDGEGQNALFADAHVGWVAKPTAGLNGDNIYTQWTNQGAQESDRSAGNPPTPGGKQTPADDKDTLIYP
ncbi:MAG TPA: DUF4190 domain-containing protein [Phycisphaerae bacterium]|nr:DUF4190 domain-containing protein [Phycisphaerae bacterium]